ncbi:MAG: hypothetical protein IPM50_08290 [Acidobacteriota bacterium]|nr:MAG: hypothetical protein IPM50_08290 [Acidobacteriota bacterium]
MFARTSLVLLVLLTGSITPVSQDARFQAEESPLSTVFYLISQDQYNERPREKACLAISFAEVGKADKAKKTASLLTEDHYAETDLILVVDSLIKNRRNREASDMALYLLKRFEKNEYRLRPLWRYLVILDQETAAFDVASTLEPVDQFESNILIAEALIEKGNKSVATTILNSLITYLEETQYEEKRDVAKTALLFAKLGDKGKSFDLAEKAVRNISWNERPLEPDDAFAVREVIALYLILGEYDFAFDVARRAGEVDEPRFLIRLGESLFSKGNREAAMAHFKEAISRLDPKQYADSFNLTILAEVFMGIGETEQAVTIAKTLTGSDYAQQNLLLRLAANYQAANKRAKALELLRFAYSRTLLIDTSEAESGSLWTSGKWEQAKYQAEIARRFAKLRADKETLKLISQIRKPYLKAEMLTEFVLMNKNELPDKTLNRYLDEAVSNLRRPFDEVFDARRFDVFGKTGRAYAEIGHTAKANGVFAESLFLLANERGMSSGLLFGMCAIGIEFEKSKIKANEKLRAALSSIIDSWELEEDEN